MVGIKDVAALAGVSISTVSYVMTGKTSNRSKNSSTGITGRT